MMNYVLITKSGRVMCFYLKSVAEMYQGAYGGVICSEEINVNTVETIKL